MDLDCPNAETCDGTLTFRVYQDSDGDPSIPYGTRTWTDAECDAQTCACEFDETTWNRLIADAIEADRNWEPSFG